MEIRKLTTPEEWKQSDQISSMVFFFPIDKDEVYEPVANRTIWGMVDGGMVISHITVWEYEMVYHGKHVPMFDIGNVGTRMEYRRKGYIRELFLAIFKEMRERGYVFSYLYPFSNSYYSQYGYSLGVMKTAVKIPVSQLSGYRCDYDVTMFNPGDSPQPYKAVYEQFAASYTGMAKLNDWRKLDEYDPAKNSQFMYPLL